jgi:transcriptional regulator with XRE-family HTH domain
MKTCWSFEIIVMLNFRMSVVLSHYRHSKLIFRLLPKMAKAVTSIKEFVDLIGSNINAARRIKGITMQQLGDDIGMDRAAISKIENGKNITMETLVKIAAALEIQPSELMQGTLVVSDYDLEAYIVERKSFKNKNRRLSSNSDSKS